MLTERGAPGDRERAETLYDQAAAEYGRHKIVPFAQRLAGKRRVSR